MPEYSSTPITPADAVQTPAMNGSTSGNYTLAALRDFILASKGQANGLASLGSDGKLTAAQVPDTLADVIVVASYAVLPATGTAGKLYITANDNKMYRWDPDLATPDYVELSVDLSAYATIADLQDGTIVVKEAEIASKDEDGNNIKATYATKTELASEVSDLEAADSNLNNAISQHEARIENLEEAHGSYHEVDVKSVYTIPSGKGENWLWDKARGVSRVENNKCYKDLDTIKTFNTEGTWSDNVYSHNSGITFTYDEDTGKVTANGTATSNATFIFNSSAQLASGHKYLVYSGMSQTGSASTFEFMIVRFYAGSANLNMYTIGDVIQSTADNDPNMIQCVVRSGVTVTNLTYQPVVRDLNIYFNNTIPSDADTIAEIQTNYPWLLTPSAYDAGSGVNTIYEGIRSIGVNIWDEQWEVGGFDGNGNPISSSNIRSKNYIPIRMATSIYILDPSYGSSGHNIVFYDYAKNIIKVVIGTTANRVMAVGTEFPTNACFMKFAEPSTYGLTYKGDLQVSEVPSGTATTLNTTYHPHFERTLSLSTPVSLKSAGSVADTYELNVEVNGEDKSRLTQMIDSVTIGSLTWSDSSSFDGCFEASINDFKANYGNVLCAPYLMVTSGATFVDKTIYCRNNGTSVFVKDSAYNSASAFKTAMTNVPIYYEKATPTVTLSDPIINNTIKTEAGGTIESILTNPVDDSMTIGYLTL